MRATLFRILLVLGAIGVSLALSAARPARAAGLGSACTLGYYSATGLSPCIAALPGFYVNTTGATAPTICPAGTVCPSGATSVPTEVLAGYYAPAGSITGTQCPAGNFCPAGSAAPKADVPGTYSAAGASAATQCPAGNFCPDPQMAQPFRDQPGYYSPAGATAPTICPAGTFCANSGTVTPAIDPAGSYSAAGAASATICPAGTYCPIGSAAPIQDSVGSYSPAGSANQIPCPPGASCAGGLLVGSVEQNLLIDPANPTVTTAITLAATAIGGTQTQTLLLGLPATDSPYQITGFSLTGGGAGQFSLVGLAVNQIVKANQPLGFALDFTPTGLGPVSAILTIDAAPYGGPDPSFLFNVSGNGLPVPEPAGAGLLLAGLAGLCGLRARRRAR